MKHGEKGVEKGGGKGGRRREGRERIGGMRRGGERGGKIGGSEGRKGGKQGVLFFAKVASSGELRNIYQSKKRKSSEANSGSIHPYSRYGSAVKIRKTFSIIAILWPTVEVDIVHEQFLKNIPLVLGVTESFWLQHHSQVGCLCSNFTTNLQTSSAAAIADSNFFSSPPILDPYP